jgi:signal transduction histidine kinase
VNKEYNHFAIGLSIILLLQTVGYYYDFYIVQEIVILLLIFWCAILLFLNFYNKKNFIEKISTAEELKYLKHAVDNVEIAICIRNYNLDIIYFNSYYAALLISDNFKIGDAGYELDSCSKANAHKSLLSESIQISERPLSVQNNRRIYQFIDKPLTNLKVIISTAYDITNKSSVIENFNISEFAYKEFLENITVGIAIFDSNRKLQFYNQSFTRLWGLVNEYLDTKPQFENILYKLHQDRKITEHANFTQYIQEQIKLFDTLTTSNSTFLHLPDGRSIKSIIIPQALGGLLFSYEDMTDHYALQTSYNILFKVHTTTLDNVQEAISVFGRDGSLTLFNNKFVNLWKIDISILKNNPNLFGLTDQYEKFFIKEEDIKKHNNLIYTSFSERKISNIIINRADNIIVKRIIVPLPDGAIMISDLDITDSYLFEQSITERYKALENSDYIKLKFLENVSYELRSPLMSIMGFSELLKSDKNIALSTKQSEYIGYILDASKKLSESIKDIIDVSLIEQEELVLCLEECNILEIITNIINRYEDVIQHQNLNIILSEEEGKIGPCLLDNDKFYQIIAKLIKNAIEHSPHHSSVTIKLIKNNHDFTITVHNQGEMIPLEEQIFVFDKFYQGYNNKVIGRSGTGLGLVIVKKYVELHSGTISFVSSPKDGTTFYCTLPYNEP